MDFFVLHGSKVLPWVDDWSSRQPFQLMTIPLVPSSLSSCLFLAELIFLLILTLRDKPRSAFPTLWKQRLTSFRSELMVLFSSSLSLMLNVSFTHHRFDCRCKKSYLTVDYTTPTLPRKVVLNSQMCAHTQAFTTLWTQSLNTDVQINNNRTADGADKKGTTHTQTQTQHQLIRIKEMMRIWEQKKPFTRVSETEL